MLDASSPWPVRLAMSSSRHPALVPRGADLVGISEVVGEPLLFGLPAAVPVKVDPLLLPTRHNVQHALKEFTSGPRFDANALDRELGMPSEELRERALHLHDG